MDWESGCLVGAVVCQAEDQVDHQGMVETQMEGTQGVEVSDLGTLTQPLGLLL